MSNFEFITALRLVNETGGTKRIGDICADLGVRRPGIVTDAGVVAAGLLGPLTAALDDAGIVYTLFDQVIADPPEAQVLSAVEFLRQADIDGVIGFGGGSSMDSAKLVALLLGGGEALADVYGVNNARGQRLPLIQIPTTAGTGSEVTAVAIVTTGETTKTGVVAPQLLPDIVLLDAGLTLGLPPHITAATGIDAMVHAVEAYTSAIKKNPYSDMLAREALTLMAANIRTATHDGGNVAAREAMLRGACLAGQAFANAPVAAVHALAYPLGGHYHIPHGLSNSLVLPHVLRFNTESAADLYAELATVISAVNPVAAVTSLPDYFEELIADLALPATLSEMKIAAADLPMLAADAMLQQRLLVNNPRPVSEADALNIYTQAWG